MRSNCSERVILSPAHGLCAESPPGLTDGKKPEFDKPDGLAEERQPKDPDGVAFRLHDEGLCVSFG